MPVLGMNIDHVATLRQARYRAGPGGSTGYGEPDVVPAAAEAVLGGAACITVHLREDRRHIIDRDVELLRQTVPVKFNLEMASTNEMLALARRLAVHQATLVPEGRAEVTTEGGLNVAGDPARWADTVSQLRSAGIEASAFIDPDPVQVHAAHAAGFHACEIHTGRYAHACALMGGHCEGPAATRELGLVAQAGELVRSLGMRFNAGHALNYVNTPPIARLAGISELHIGHSIVARSVYVGLRQAVREMIDLIDRSTRAKGH